MRTWLLIGLCLGSLFAAQAQDKPAYRLYTSQGNTVTYHELLELFSRADVVLLGELHNNPICHWLQMEITHDLYALDSNLVLGAEMFEADNQLVLDEYLQGRIRFKDVEREAKVWPNYATDYAPLLRFAEKKNLPFIATNVPRRYASLVSRKGLSALQALTPEALALMAPLPFPFDTAAPGYQDMLHMDFGHGMGMDATNMVYAQALKDATMAHFLVQNRQEGQRFVHYQGDFHSANGGGIVWYLERYAPKLQVAVLSSVESESLDWDEAWAGKADFILVIPKRMGKTY